MDYFLLKTAIRRQVVENIHEMLEKIKSGEISVEEAELFFKKRPFEDIGYAKVDTHRKIRNGAYEVIYGAGKTADQIAGIIRTMADSGQERILITRMDPDKAKKVKSKLVGQIGFNDLASQANADSSNKTIKIDYHEEANIGIIGDFPKADGLGKIVVATGGTSDIPVAEEAALTAEFLGNDVTRLYDVGVAGLHRTLAHMDDIMSAKVIIAIAGMEGALASVIGGLAECPVIAVPTSVGYGASFHGLSALLSMLNSCASGVSVVNIDNGFGAAYQASLINHMR
jgi:NCAIR mutase (PurE)-related protein